MTQWPAVFVEVCAGSAILSAEAAKKGYQTFPIDHAHNRFSPKASIFPMDLSTDAARKLMPEMFKFLRPSWAHFGLPCGTCSRARERPISSELKADGAPQPRPLRDAANLMGKDGLNLHEHQRVQSANAVYITAEIILFCCFLYGTCVTLENPERSWLWAILASLVKQRCNDQYTDWYFALDDVIFDTCQHGGDFPKTTRLKCSAPHFRHLGQLCDGSHQHATWQVRKTDTGWIFDTAAEAAYPRVLAERMVLAASQSTIPGQLENTYKSFRLESLKQADHQSKVHRQLIPEFSKVDEVAVLPSAGDYKLLSSPMTTGEKDNGDGEILKKAKLGYKIGWYYSMTEHFEQACRLRHPAFDFLIVPDILRRNLFDLLTRGPKAVAESRIGALKDIMKLKLELQPEEDKLRSKLEPHVNEVTAGKALCLFRRLLEETDFPDMNVCKFMEQGVVLTGYEEDSNLYQKKIKVADMTVEQLNHQAIWRRRELMCRPMSTEELGQADDLERETSEEVTAGFLKGPFTEEQVTELLGCSDWSLTKRFALHQSDKVRIIDNYKESGVNSCYGSSSYLALHDTDFIVGFLRLVMAACSRSDWVTIPLSDGTLLQGKMHKSVRACSGWVGRCVDLSKAYKQVAIDKLSLKHGVLGYRDKKGDWRLYTTQSLPFGASSSVFAFNKLSRALWHILTAKVGLLTTVYYDDFPCIELGELANLTTKLIDAVLNTLGWRHAISGKKAIGFGSTLTALGVEYDLQNLWNGKLVVQNKAGRMDRMLTLVSDLRSQKSNFRGIAASLQGLLNFAGGFVMGNHLKLASHSLARWSSGEKVSLDSLNSLCDFLGVVLEGAMPRHIELLDCELPLIIYTDGAFENDVGSWGVAIYDPLEKRGRVFGGIVPKVLTDFWLKKVGKQIICEVEFFAILCVRWHLRMKLHRRHGFMFIDNEACRMVAVKRSSSSPHMFRMSAFLGLVDAVSPFSCWYERVPSPSNLADLPSRSRSNDLCLQFGFEDGGDIILPGFVLNFLMDKHFNPSLAKLIQFETL